MFVNVAFRQPFQCLQLFLLQQKKIMAVLDGLLSGLTGGYQLYSGVKGLFGSKDSRADKLLSKARASEDAWYRRNYYSDYLNSSMARSAMKRVEDTLSRNSRQNRAYAAVVGTTPEYLLAQNGQGLRSMDNLMTELASQEDARRYSVDAQHQQNQENLRNMQLGLMQYQRNRADSDIDNGLSLIKDAVKAAEWGKEIDKVFKPTE